MFQYPYRCPTDKRLHRNPQPHPPTWPSPPDPPTGTPRNGTRTPRPAGLVPPVNANLQLLTPPNSQQQVAAAAPEADAEFVVSNSSRHSTPSPSLPLDRFERAASPQVIIETPAGNQYSLPTPGAPTKLVLQVDTELNSFDPVTPTPAPAPASATRASTSPAPAPASPVEMDPFIQSASPAQTIQVMGTPLLDQPPPRQDQQQRAADLAAHHRRTLDNRGARERGSVASSSAESNNRANILQTRVENLRTERAHLVEQVNDLTACIDRVRVRNRIAELNEQHERAVAEKARADAETARIETRGVERTVGRWQVAFGVGVLLMVLFGGWCWRNSPDNQHIRKRQCENLGLPPDC